jgi:hypothetical protein
MDRLTCQFHDPDTGEVCSMPYADYGVTYEMAQHGRLTLHVCPKHWEYYLTDMENFILDNEKGWATFMKVTR